MGKKVLFINQETAPYVPETEMSTMGNVMSLKMQDAGYEIRTFMPKWGNINERRGQLHEVIRLSGMNIIVDDTDHPLIIKVASIPQSRIQVYFIDNEDYFLRRQLTRDENGNDYADNGERAIFFARGVLETVKKLRWAPDIIHCQGWLTSVIPFYAKTAYKDEPQFANTKIVTSFFAEQPQGSLADNFKTCMEFREANTKALSKYGDTFDGLELSKLATDFSDGVVQTSNAVDSRIMEYAKASGRPVLIHPTDDSTAGAIYKDFYEKLIEG